MDLTSPDPVIVIVATVLVIGVFTLIFWTILFAFLRYKCRCCPSRVTTSATRPDSSTRDTEQVLTITNRIAQDTWSNDPPSYSNLRSSQHDWIIEVEEPHKTQSEDEKDPKETSNEPPSYDDFLGNPQRYSTLFTTNEITGESK